MRRKLTLEARLRPAADCAYQTVGNQALAIVPARRRQHFFQNETATLIWRGIEAERSLRAIRDEITASYDVTPERAEADLLALCGRLLDEGLAEIADAGTPGADRNDAPDLY